MATVSYPKGISTPCLYVVWEYGNVRKEFKCYSQEEAEQFKQKLIRQGHTKVRIDYK